MYKHIILDVIAGADGKMTLYEDPGDNNDYDTAYSTTEIRQEGGKLIVDPRKGSFEGMPSERSYCIRVHDGKGGIRNIDVPATACDKKTRNRYLTTYCKQLLKITCN